MKFWVRNKAYVHVQIRLIAWFAEIKKDRITKDIKYTKPLLPVFYETNTQIIFSLNKILMITGLS